MRFRDLCEMNGVGRRELLRLCAAALLPEGFARCCAIEERRIEQRSQKPWYEIDLRYPYLSGTETAGAAGSFNAAVRRIVRRRLAWYRAKQLPPKDSPHGGRLALRSTVTRRRDGVLSVLFDWDCAVAGNFHSRQELASLVFDLRSAEPVELPALFRPGIRWVRVLSRLAIADLIRQRERQHLDVQGEALKWIERGAGPDGRNFRVFTLGDRALTLHFVTYQVGSYAEHDRQVQLPWRTLQRYVADRWRSE